MHGRKMGTHGWGARKKHKKSGHRGGKGMAGTGKRADQRKTLITALYGNNYFGKQGVTSRKTKRDTRKRINLRDIELNLKRYGKKEGDKFIIELKNYKILDSSKDYKVTNKLVISAKEASKSAIEKIEKSGGQILLDKKAGEQPQVEKEYKKQVKTEEKVKKTLAKKK